MLPVTVSGAGGSQRTNSGLLAALAILVAKLTSLTQRFVEVVVAYLGHRGGRLFDDRVVRRGAELFQLFFSEVHRGSEVGMVESVGSVAAQIHACFSTSDNSGHGAGWLPAAVTKSFAALYRM